MVEQSNPTGTRGSLELVMILYFCSACTTLAAVAEKAPKPTSARKTPARTINTLIKTRRSKKPHGEAPLFFIRSSLGVEYQFLSKRLVACRRFLSYFGALLYCMSCINGKCSFFAKNCDCRR